MAQGDISLRNVSDLISIRTPCRWSEVNRATVKEWLEMSAGQFKQIDTSKTGVQWLVNESFPTYNFDVIDGSATRWTSPSRPATARTGSR